MSDTEKKVGKRKSGMSPESEQPPNKKYDSPRSLSGDEAYCSFSQHYQSFRGDETDGSSYEDILEMDEDDLQDIDIKSLRINYKYLTAEMEPQGIIDHLHISELFSDKFLEECKETPNRRRRNDLLIKQVHHIALNKESKVLQVFASALIKTEQSFIVDRLRTRRPDLSGTAIYKRLALKRFIVGMKGRIIDNIEPNDFIDDLVVSKAISFLEHEDITRLDLRRKRVAVIIEKAEKLDNSSWKIIKAIAETYPKLLEEFERKTRSADGMLDKQSEGGAAVSIRLNLKSGRGIQRRKYNLKEIERRTVETFDRGNAENNEMIHDLVEECRVIFEGLKISSVAIQLLTRDRDSLQEVLKKIKSGKAVKWLLSMLGEHDKSILNQIGVRTLQVSVFVDEDGNLDNLDPVQDCICRLNKDNIRQKKEALADILTDIESLLRQMNSFSVPMARLKTLLLAENSSKKSNILLDFFTSEDIPRVCFCLLEEHIKSRDPSFFESLFTNDSNENFEPLISDIKQHEDFLKEELEVHTFLHIIRSWKNEKSVRLLAKLSRCSDRSSRVAEFLRFLLSERDLTWFWEEVKKKHKYIWDTVTSSKRTRLQSKTDIVAVKLMNDTVVDDVDPSKLKQYMKEETLIDLGFCEFETIRSRKSQAQFMMNRLSTDTISEFMIALRRSGYEHIYKQIKAGKDSVPINETEEVSYIQSSTSYLLPVDINEVAISPKSGFRSPVSVGSARDSESGIFSGPDDSVYDIANKCDFDDEGIFSCSPVGSQDLDIQLTEPQIEIRAAQKKSSKSEKRERMLRLIDSSRELLQRTPRYITTNMSNSTGNEMGVASAHDTLERKSQKAKHTIGSALIAWPERTNANIPNFEEKKHAEPSPFVHTVDSKESDKEVKRSRTKSILQKHSSFTSKEEIKRADSSPFLHVTDRKESDKEVKRCSTKSIPKKHCSFTSKKYNEIGDESAHNTLDRKSQKAKHTFGSALLAWPETSKANTPNFEEIKCSETSPFVDDFDCKESDKKVKRSRTKSTLQNHSSFISKEEIKRVDSSPFMHALDSKESDKEVKRSRSKSIPQNHSSFTSKEGNAICDESVNGTLERQSQKEKITNGSAILATQERYKTEIKRADSSPFVHAADQKESDKEVKRCSTKSIPKKRSNFTSKEEIKCSETSPFVHDFDCKESDKEVKRSRTKSTLQNHSSFISKEEIKRVDSSPFMHALDSKESDKEVKRSRSKSIPQNRSSFTSKEGNAICDESVNGTLERQSQKEKITNGSALLATQERYKTDKQSFEEIKRADSSPFVHAADQKESDKEVKRCSTKSIPKKRSNFTSKEEIKCSETSPFVHDFDCKESDKEVKRSRTKSILQNHSSFISKEEIKCADSSPFVHALDSKESDKEVKHSRSKSILQNQSIFTSKEGNEMGDKKAHDTLERKSSQKAKYTKRSTLLDWPERSKANTPSFEEIQRVDSSPFLHAIDRKVIDKEVKRSRTKSIPQKHSSFTSKEGSSKHLYKRSLSDTVESGKHLKNIPYFVKSRSEDALAEYFGAMCSMQTVHEERSVSSPPNDRDRLISHKSARYRKDSFLGEQLAATSAGKSSSSEQSTDTE